MQVINWLDLQPLPADLEALSQRLQEALPLRDVCQLLVEVTLRASQSSSPWTGRADLIPCYHPSQTYKQGQRLALLLPDSQNKFLWLSAQIKSAKMVENPIQGRFQVLTLDTHGKQIQMAGGILDASYPELDLLDYTAEDLAWLAKWVSDTYAAPLQATLRKLIQEGQLPGRLAGRTFVPEHASALSAELLHPFFARISPARPWINLEEIAKGLPDLSELERETTLGLIRATLKQGPYRSLGGDRWTTIELFNQLNREVPRGLTTPQLRSKVHIWTKRDRQDLAGYGRKFIPPEALRALEELEAGERLPESDDSPWYPPKAPLRLPALNYLHISQAYFPVGYILRAFPPDTQMVFVQFMDGDHRPFMLDRENGLLKALHPEKLRTKILEDGIPAGTTLWLEHEGGEKYRIAPRRLPFKRMVPCKLAHLEDGQLHIEHTQISMRYQGAPSLFKAEMHFEEFETLFAEASRVNLRLQDAMIYAVQEICATDPDQRAHWLDIFNAVFLTRMCSPSSVSFLLYTQPCFEPLGGGYFRYKPTPVTVVKNIRKRTDRLSQLWDGFLMNPIAPVPVVEKREAVRARLEASDPLTPAFAPDLDFSSLLSQPETEQGISVTVLPFTLVEENMARKTTLKEEIRVESLLLRDYEPDLFTTRTDARVLMSEAESADPGGLSYSQGELEEAEPSALSASAGSVSAGSVSAGEADAESEASAPVPFEDAHPEFSFFSPTLGLEPKPAWVKAPVQSNPSVANTADPRRLVYRPKIPIRPLHKQRFYQRLLFYLRGWLSRKFRKTV